MMFLGLLELFPSSLIPKLACTSSLHATPYTQLSGEGSPIWGGIARVYLSRKNDK